MRTRDRLNWAFFAGSMTMAALLGVLCHSEAVFWSAAVGMLLLNICNDEIRWK